MKKLKLKTPAKINLTLDVLGVNAQGFHDIRSFVTSIDVYDYITLKKRSDFKFDLKCKGIDPKCSMSDNNAYKSAKRFAKAFKTNGVSIVVDKHIPVGAGMGGSSADIAGVLNGMKTLFSITDSVKPLADSLGSDSSYMLKGGLAILNGRGDEQEFLSLDFEFYLLIVLQDEVIASKQCYQRFDEQNKIYSPCTDAIVSALKNKDFNEFCRLAKNDLYSSTASFIPEIENNIKALKDAGAPLAIMTGSGSAVVGVFDNAKERDKAYKKLKKTCGKKILKAKTI